jgi:hypothetical protein
MKLINHINHIVKEKRRIVIEGLFASKERIVIIKDLFRKKNLPLKTVLLTAPLDIIKNRLKNRKKKNDISYEDILRFHDKFSSSSEADCIINTECYELSNLNLLLERILRL